MTNAVASARRTRRNAFTLLEVLLSIAILGTSLAIIGNGFHATLTNMHEAQQEVRAALIAETILSQVAAGAIAPESTEGDYDLDPRWHYALTVEPMSDVDGLLQVRVEVGRGDLERPRKVALARWVTDPLWLEEQAANLAAQKEAEAAAAAPATGSTTGASGGTSGSGSSGTSATGGSGR
ncbi:MAG: type II secretion system protein [Pirellulales bacterium]